MGSVKASYLIVDFSKGRRHFVGDGASDDNNVGLTRRRSENDPISIHVVARGGNVHHLNGATGENKTGMDRFQDCCKA